MVILLSRIFGRKNSSHLPDKWIFIIHQVIESGSILNWGEIISSNLDIQLKKLQKEDKFYMDSYLLDVIYARREYPSLGWKWTSSLPSIHVYCKMLWENIYKEDYDKICDGLFAPIYQILFGKEASCCYPKGKHVDGTMREIQKDEVLFEKIDEDPMLVATVSVTLNQDNVLNISLLNEREAEGKLENQKLKDEIIGFKE